MGCLIFVIVLAMPRLVMVVLWVFTDYLSTAFDGVLLPFLGFFLLPTTTLAYAVAQNEKGGVEGWALLLVIIAVLLDLGSMGGGKRAYRRD